MRTKLERIIVKEARKHIPEIKKLLEGRIFDSKYVRFPFIVDGVFDYIVYNTETCKFEYIEYSFGIGQGISDGIYETSAMFDESEIRRINL